MVGKTEIERAAVMSGEISASGRIWTVGPWALKGDCVHLMDSVQLLGRRAGDILN